MEAGIRLDEMNGARAAFARGAGDQFKETRRRRGHHQRLHRVNFNACVDNANSRLLPQYIERAREGGELHAERLGNQHFVIGQMKDDAFIHTWVNPHLTLTVNWDRSGETIACASQTIRRTIAATNPAWKEMAAIGPNISTLV
jgi:hypothetical protein